MTAFAYYRLPYLHHATYVEQHGGRLEVLSSVAELNGKEGFVIAPFSPSSDCPVLLIHPDKSKLIPVQMDASENEVLQGKPLVSGMEKDKVSNDKIPHRSDSYVKDFDCFHCQLEKDVFRKIVLARMERISGALKVNDSERNGGILDKNLLELIFKKTCLLYPRLFVALVYTPQSGVWLMATPEILLRGEGGEFSTMSLAGTQKAEPSKTIADYPVEGVTWSEKNQEEQQYVTDYIEQCVKTFTEDYSLKGPYTTMAANLYHLRTDINFRLDDTCHMGDVLERLYPTPAVCGIPKAETREFILRHEHQPRKYYSGFVGPLSLSGKTHLFVSLRCMNILQDGTCELYAGGGLLKESVMESEWNETEAKLQTIKRVL